MARRGLSVTRADVGAINTQLGLLDGITQLLTLTGNLPDSAITYASESANKVFSGPDGTVATTGTPAFRSLVTGDIPSLDASKITTGTLALARGGTNADLSASGGATSVLAQDASHVITARALIAADIPNHDASKITTGTLALARGGTNADLSGTGGAKQYVKQATLGGAFTVGTIPASDVASGAALTKTDDTNVTMTLGGTPSTALLTASSLTLGWTGLLGLARGGSNADLSATGGANKFVKQSSAGAALTVAALVAGDVPDLALTTNVALLNRTSQTWTGGAQTWSTSAATNTQHTYSGSTTGSHYVRFTNTSGDVAFGVDTSAGTTSGTAYAAFIDVIANQPLILMTNNTKRTQLDGLGNLVHGTAALGTTATDGFLYIPTCAGTPTGVPTGFTGTVPIVFDTSGVKIWVRTGGAWKGVVVA